MCLECLERFGVPLDPAHHAALKRRPNRHVRGVKKVTPPAGTATSAPTATTKAKTTQPIRSTFRC
ncbi:MAG: hypothetical protein WCG63_07155 [Opitutaceae bacterium]